MARDHILEKIKAEMTHLPIRRESQVVYLLAEIRKVVEQLSSGETATCPNLRFFCNWALHSRIDHSDGAIKEFCKVFDMYDIHTGSLQSTQFLQSMIMIRPLREDLTNFLNLFSINSQIVTDELEWYRFLYHYTGVISDVPLVRSRPVSDQEVKEVRVSRAPSGNGLPDRVHWSITLGDSTPRTASTLLGLLRGPEGQVVEIRNFLLR